MEGSKNSAGNVTRLMITKMVLENFKSYAGQQNIGPFHKRFSSIVGPNGSGKSNVIDALLFVFGKRAKQLRLNKVSELIHKSSGFPNLEYARVEVHFQLIVDEFEHDDNYEVVPGSEFIVTRTAFQNNQSKYTIDGKNSTYTEVGVLLRHHGIDLDNNRFLILQGEVEQIAMMKPKAQGPHEEGLLEYLEDIIGSNKYLEPIEELSKTLDGLNEQRIEKVNRMKVAERERDNLSGSKQEAEEYLDKESDIRKSKNLLYQHLIHNATTIVTDASEKKTVGQEKLDYERNKMKEKENDLKEAEKAYNSGSKKFDKIVDELQKANTDFAAFERRDIKLQEDLKHVATQRKKLDTAVSKEVKKEQDSTRDAEKLKKEVNMLTGSVNDVSERRAEEEAKLDEIMNGMQEATKPLRETLEGKLVELGVAEKAVSSFQTDKETVQTSLQILESRASTATRNISSSQEKLVTLAKEKASLIEKVADISTRKNAATARIDSLSKSISHSVQVEEPKLSSGIREAVMAVEQCKEALQEPTGKIPAAVSELLKESRAGGKLAGAGVVGRLGDLATVAPEYDVAVSTATGMLDSIVVRNTEGGQACMEFLRKFDVGRATFIVLDQLDAARRGMQERVNPPTGASRLLDLIEVEDAELRAAFFVAFKNTLVAKDLDTAVKLAYVGDKVKWKMVTLDGKMIDITGAMSGGGSTSKSGSMRITGRGVVSTTASSAPSANTGAKLGALEAEVLALQAALTQCRSNRAALEKELKECKASLKPLDVDFQKSTMAQKRHAEQEVEIQAKIDGWMRDSQLTPQEEEERVHLQERIQVIEQDICKHSPNLASIQAEVAAIQKQIFEMGGLKLKRTKNRLEELTTQLDGMRESLSTKEVEVSSLQKQGKKAIVAKGKAEEELVQLKKREASLAAEQEEMENDAQQVMLAVQQVGQLKKAEEESLKTIKASFEEIRNVVGTIKSVELDLVTQIDDYKKVIKENEDVAKHWQKQLDVVRTTHLAEAAEMKSIMKPYELTTLGGNKVSTDMDVEEPDGGDAPADSLPVLLPNQFANTRSETDELRRNITVLEGEREKLKDNVDMSALSQYMRKDSDYRSRLLDLEAVTSERNEARKSFEELRRQRLEDFMSGFGVITLKLKEMYQMITLGGDAELELVDSLDPFSEGIVFSVRPPKKSWKNISNLSGGEKTLSSLALVFALHHYKPTPLYVMDEIDAALDFKNVSIVANYIKERTKNAQFVIISLRNNMFELADRLVGIYKTHDATKSVTINPKLFEKAVAGGQSGDGHKG